ncbi:MAG: universal stress protein [Desulfobacteraceae bacterium]|nr:universal stress protein [Desulfobacteraceae bacterium]
MEERKILFPYNFTRKDQAALDYIVSNYAGLENTKVTVFHAYVPVPEVVIGSNTVMERMSRNLSFLRQKVVEQEGKMRAVKQLLLNGGFNENQVNYLYLPKRKDVAKEIAALVRDEGYHMIILSRSKKVSGFFKSSVSIKLVSALENVLLTIVT